MSKCLLLFVQIVGCVWADAHSFSDFKICKLRHFCTCCDDVTDYVIDFVITGDALSQQRVRGRSRQTRADNNKLSSQRQHRDSAYPAASKRPA